MVARALWYVKPGVAELRAERLERPRPGEALVKTLYSALSRGTERLVAFGHVPKSEWQSMRAPFQSGAFSFPVKYGYSAAGIVVAGGDDMIGQRVFCLHPHQDFFLAPQASLVAIPDHIPSRRATLAANMETALNAHWDAGTTAGDRVLVIGAGLVGLLTARLAQRIAGADVLVTDVNPARKALAEAIGVPFASSATGAGERRLVFHTSASGPGLQNAIDAAAPEGRIIEMSWYGDQPVTLSLGGAFHAKRLAIVSSQVGRVAASHRASMTPRDRLILALSLLDDPTLDVLAAGEIAFEDVASRVPQLLTDTVGALAPVIRYSDDREAS